MASWIHISVCIIAVLGLNTVNGADLRATPSTIMIGGSNPTASVDITCRPDLSGITSIYVIEIGTKTQSNTNHPVIQIENTNPNTVLVIDTSYGSRMATSGSISGTTGTLTMTLQNPLSCNDAASYYCTASVKVSSVTTDDGAVNVTAQTNPGNIVMTPSPRKESLYDIGETVTFSCYGQIGNREGSMENLWNWQWRDTSGGFNSQWTTYPNTHNNITYESKVAAANCQYTARSVLTHVVKSTDNGREFQCFFSNEIYQDNFTIYTENQNPVNPGNPGGVTNTAGANIGLILGVVFGVLAAIVIVVVIVYFLVFRKKSGGEDYDTGEGKDDRPPDNVVYSTPASKENRPKSNKGRENEAMDEAHEKNPRPYYANDYADHGRTNQAMDDDSKHDRSYDDDNTDSRMRQPYGSAV